MEPFGGFGKTLILLGAALVVLGVVFLAAPKIPFLGKLPGDIHLRGKNWSFYFPVVTCIVISVVLTLLFNFFSRK